MDIVLAPCRADRCVDAGEAVDAVILEREAARRIDQIGDAGDIIIRIIAISHRPDVGAVVRGAVAAVGAAAGDAALPIWGFSHLSPQFLPAQFVTLIWRD